MPGHQQAWCCGGKIEWKGWEHPAIVCPVPGRFSFPGRGGGDIACMCANRDDSVSAWGKAAAQRLRAGGVAEQRCTPDWVPGSGGLPIGSGVCLTTGSVHDQLVRVPWSQCEGCVREALVKLGTQGSGSYEM